MPAPSASCSTPCPSRWSRSSTTSPSTSTAPSPSCSKGRGADAGGLLRPDGARSCCARTAQRSRRCAGPSWTIRRRLPDQAGACAAWSRPCSTSAAPRQSRDRQASETPRAICWKQNGFDREQHEQIRADLKDGRIGLAQNRLPASAVIEDVRPDDVIDADRRMRLAELRSPGWRRWQGGEVAVVTLAAGAGSRWTQGAGVVKALHPFCKLGGRHRTFHRDAPGQKPPGRARSRRRRSRTSSPPAISRTSRSSEFLARQQQLRLRRPAAAFAGPIGRPAHGPDGARPALRVGGNAATDARRAAAKGPRQPARTR